MGEQRFRAEIQPEGGSAYVELPFDVPAEFGTRGRVSLKGTLNGVPFTTSTSPRHGRWYIVINRALRDDAGVGPGDTVDLVVDRDDEPRTIDAPEDLQAALAAAPAALEVWGRMSYSHRKQYVTWVTDAKREETRARRVEQAVPMIAEGRRRT
jgi:hypothetical protein